MPAAQWRDDIDALAFRLAGDENFCIVHRLAFRSLMGSLPLPQDCLDWFKSHYAAFESAAQAKIARGVRGNFHLTSRDIAGQLRPISR
jgi:hypothetical protein